MREIVLDTETTGLDPATGDRLIEIGCIELWNHLPTGRTFQTYLNPQCPMKPESIRITGLTDAFLLDKPLFEEKVSEFLEFIEDSPLVIHNAPFDMKFLNAELQTLKLNLLSMERVTDTLRLARQKFPGSPTSLDALCRRYEISLDDRSKHGALLDADLLAKVYLELLGGRQTTLSFSKLSEEKRLQERASVQFPRRSFPISPEEEELHVAFISSLKDPLWLTILERKGAA